MVGIIRHKRENEWQKEEQSEQSERNQEPGSAAGFIPSRTCRIFRRRNFAGTFSKGTSCWEKTCWNHAGTRLAGNIKTGRDLPGYLAGSRSAEHSLGAKAAEQFHHRAHVWFSSRGGYGRRATADVAAFWFETERKFARRKGHLRHLGQHSRW